MEIALLVHGVLGNAPISVRAYDDSQVEVPDAVATLIVRSPNALRRFITAPSELGLGRAYVAGELDVEGDLFGALAAVAELDLHIDRRLLVELTRTVGC